MCYNDVFLIFEKNKFSRLMHKAFFSTDKNLSKYLNELS